MADAVPESLLVGIGCAALLLIFRLGRTRLFGNGNARGFCHFGIHTLLAFQAVDFFSQVHYIRFHLVIMGGIFRRNHAVIVTCRIQEGFRRIPEVLAFLAQC